MSTLEPTSRPRFLSEADYHDIIARVRRFAKGGGSTNLLVYSGWKGYVRWARNQTSMSGEVRENLFILSRSVGGNTGWRVWFNGTSDPTIVAACRRSERMGLQQPGQTQFDFVDKQPLESLQGLNIFSDATYNLDADRRAEIARQLAQSAADAGMMSAGYIEVSAHSQGIFDTLGRSRYFQWTGAQYSVTVRDPKGTGSGWAGVDWYDWAKIDSAKISQVALDKCLASRNPVAVEPGRYTTILEPQAVCDFIGWLFFQISALSRMDNETQLGMPFTKSRGFSNIGMKVADERITVSSSPLDPELGFPPFPGYFDPGGDPFDHENFHPVTWIENGILKELWYPRDYAIESLGRDNSQGVPGAFHMHGGKTSIEEMIATTKRGLLVTRFDQTQLLDEGSLLYCGYTRDGLWLIENGKISKPAKNLAFTESILFALNNVEQIGGAQRAFHPLQGWGWSQPVVVPPLKIRDFSFTSLADAV